MSSGQGGDPLTKPPKTTTQSKVVPQLTDYYAKKIAEKMDMDIMALFTGKPTPKLKPLTKWQKLRKLPRNIYQSLGEKLTRKLMDKFGVYDEWY